MENLHAPRILRADIEEFEPEPPPLPKRRQLQRDRIYALVPRLLARRGVAGVNLSNLALALDISTSALRRHVVDMQYLLFKILHAHLHAVLAGVQAIPQSDPDCAARRHAAYRAATRATEGTFLPAHTLFIRDRASLPPDLFEPLDELRAQIQSACAAIAEDLAPRASQTALALPQQPQRPSAHPAQSQPPAQPQPPSGPQLPPRNGVMDNAVFQANIAASVRQQLAGSALSTRSTETASTPPSQAA